MKHPETKEGIPIKKKLIKQTAGSINAWLTNNGVCVFAALIPFTIMMCIFIVNKIYPFGDESFMHSDMYHQYVPFLSELLHKIQNGESLSYSWNVGAGSNFLALYAYYLASPLNWLSILLPEQFLIEFMSYMVVFKIALSGFTFCWYLTRHFRTRSITVIPFAVFYAMSGFLAAFNWNVMWMDVIVLFPLIALGLECLVKEGKYRLYCICLAICILSNYYLSIMVCIFTVLYFVVLLVSAQKRLRAIRYFVLFSALAGGMAAVLLVPVYAALNLTQFTDFTFPKTATIYFSMIEMLARHFINVTTETGLDHWPNIFCGVAVLILTPLYASNSRIPLRERAAKLFLLGFLLLSFALNILNFVWHGFNYPNSLPCRQSFMYIFLLLTICCEAVLRIRESSSKSLGVSLALALGFVFLCENLIDNEAFPKETFYLTAFFLCLYGAILYAYQKRVRMICLLGFFTLVVFVTEASANMYNTSVSTTNRSKYLENHDNYARLTERTGSTDPDFYRFEKFSRVTKNDGTMIGYPTASVFSSTVNGNMVEFYSRLGMSQSKVFYCFDGATPFTSALLGVRYMYSKSPDEDPSLYTLTDQEGDIYLYKCKYTLPLGFMVNTIPNTGETDSGKPVTVLDDTGTVIAVETAAANVPAGEMAADNIPENIPDGNPAAVPAAARPDSSETDTETTDPLDELLGNVEDSRTDVLERALDQPHTSPLETQNRMAAALDITDPLFISSAISADGDASIIEVAVSGHYYAYVGNNSVDTVKLESEAGSKSFTKVKYHYILDLGWHDTGDTITLQDEDKASLNLFAYRLDESVLSQAVSRLNRDAMTVTSCDSTHISGTVTVTQAGELVMSVPYEPGWRILVDGEEVQPGLFDNTLISLDLDTGTHTIEMSYRPAGLTLGLIISLICLTAFVTILILDHRRKKDIVSAETMPPVTE